MSPRVPEGRDEVLRALRELTREERSDLLKHAHRGRAPEDPSRAALLLGWVRMTRSTLWRRPQFLLLPVFTAAPALVRLLRGDVPSPFFLIPPAIVLTMMLVIYAYFRPRYDRAERACLQVLGISDDPSP